MAYTNVDFLADQLRASDPAAGWNAQGVDRARELAGILLAAGIRDLSRLAVAKVTITDRPFSWWSEVPQETSIALFYEGRYLGFLGEPGKPANEPTLQFVGNGYIAAWSPVGHGNVSYYVAPRAGGFIFLPAWGSSSDAGDIRESVLTAASMLVFFVLPAAGISLAGIIGQAVIGPSLAATYPALASAIGNVALSTAFNGGNIEAAVSSAVQNAVAGGVGFEVADTVGAVFDSHVIGSVAAASTRAALLGQDIETAALTELARNGGAIVDYWTEDNGDPFYSEGASGAGGSGPVLWNDPAPTDAPPLFPWLDPVPIPEIVDAPTVYYVGGNAGQLPTDLPLIDYALPPPKLAPIPEPPVEMPQAPKSDSFSWGSVANVINTVSVAAVSALKLNAAFSSPAAPGVVVTQARSVNADGSVTSALRDGTVQVRRPDGTVCVARPPVGVAQSTVDGAVIVNNGDNTYDLVTSQGQRRTFEYAANTGSDGLDLSKVPVGVWLGVAGLAVSLFK